MFWFFPAAFGNNWWRWKWWWQWKWWWWWWWWWRCAGARSRPGPDSVCRKPRINVNSQLEREWDPQLKLENDTLSRPFQTIANEYMRAKRRSYRQLFSVDDFRLSQSLFRIFFLLSQRKSKNVKAQDKWKKSGWKLRPTQPLRWWWLSLMMMLTMMKMMNMVMRITWATVGGRLFL